MHRDFFLKGFVKLYYQFGTNNFSQIKILSTWKLVPRSITTPLSETIKYKLYQI